MNYFEDLERHVAEMEKLVSPLRFQHERVSADLAAAVAHFRIGDDLNRAMHAVAAPQFHDFAAVHALANPIGRDFEETIRAITAQTKWIEEAYRSITHPAVEIQAAAVAAIEKLVGSRTLALDEFTWSNPRPFGHALNDILYAGRSSWALRYSWSAASPNATKAAVARVVREGEHVITEFAKADPGADQLIAAPEAEREAEGVSEVLAERVVKYSKTEPSASPLIQPDAAAIVSIGFLTTVAEVMRVVETRAGKPVAGRYCAWAFGAALEAMDEERTPKDRFEGLVRFFHDFFVDAVDRADQSLRAVRPAFFSETIRDLRHTESAHAPEASNKPTRIAENLDLREKRLTELAGKVPATTDEWRLALGKLLRKAAEAAVEFRDRLA